MMLPVTIGERLLARSIADTHKPNHMQIHLTYQSHEEESRKPT